MRGANWRPSSAQSAKTCSESPPPSVVPPGRHLALVVEQSVEDMQRLARGRRNDLGKERSIAVRQVGVDLEGR